MTNIMPADPGRPSDSPGQRTDFERQDNSEQLASSELNQSGPESATAYNTRRGTLWSIFAGLCVFAAILYAVWYYLYPRLSGEVVAVTARVGFHEILRAGSEAAQEWKSPDGTRYQLGITPVLTAKDLATFQPRMISGDSEKKQIELNIILSNEGKVRLQDFAARRGAFDAHPETAAEATRGDDSSAQTARKSTGELGVVIHGHFVGVVSNVSAQSDRVSVTLFGMTRDDIEEIFARLTE